MNRDEDVSERERIALVLVDANDVKAERRQHRLRELADLERVGRLLEVRNEATLAPLAELAALLAGYAVRRLALGDVLELRTLDDLLADRRRAITRRGGVRGCDRPWGS